MGSFVAVTASWLSPFVWMDYRLALLFTVGAPLVLLLWAFVQKSEAIVRLLIIYWRVASLLAITVYLMIAALPISYIVSLLARTLVPISLWFWRDINEDITDQQPSVLKFALLAWRWAITVYSGLGAIVQLFFVKCAFQSQNLLLNDDYCNVWLAPPWMYKQIFHANTKVTILGFVGIVSLLIYLIYLGYFLVVKLSKKGRTAYSN